MPPKAGLTGSGAAGAGGAGATAATVSTGAAIGASLATTAAVWIGGGAWSRCGLGGGGGGGSIFLGSGGCTNSTASFDAFGFVSAVTDSPSAYQVPMACKATTVTTTTASSQ